MRLCVYQLVVHPEEGHLTRFVEQVGESDEGLSLLQVEDEYRRDEGHALNLKHHTVQSAGREGAGLVATAPREPR